MTATHLALFLDTVNGDRLFALWWLIGNVGAGEGGDAQSARHPR
jgi:hypothetical protein